MIVSAKSQREAGRKSVRSVRCLLVALFAFSAALSLETAHAIDPRDNTQQTSTEAPAPPPPRAARQPTRRQPQASPGAWLIDYSTDAAWFIDQTQVQFDGREVRAWITIVYSRPQNEVAYYSTLYAFDCDRRRFRALDGAFYASDGRSLGPINETPYAYSIPDSMADLALTVGCTDFAEWGTVLGLARVPPGLTITQATANIFRASAPRLTIEFLRGSWTQNNNCADVLLLRADGTFTITGASYYGNWRLAGEQLTLAANGQSIVTRIELLDANSIRTYETNGSVTTLRRC